MYACIYVCMYVRTYVCMHVYTYVCLHTCNYTNVLLVMYVQYLAGNRMLPAAPVRQLSRAVARSYENKFQKTTGFGLRLAV